jgi:hypothetical protein
MLKKLMKFFLGGKNSNATIKDDSSRTTPPVKEKTLEELYPNMTDDEICAAILEKEEDELTTLEIKIKFYLVVQKERNRARSVALKDSFNLNEQKFETDNPYKELIYFTLNYFDELNAENPSETKELIISSFPLMKDSIISYISKDQSVNTSEWDFDEELAYNEFKNFCANYFLTRYQNEQIRNQEIKKHFKLAHADFIKYLNYEAE